MKIDNPFVTALRSYRQILSSIIVFSIAINALMFVSPLYMLQVYDRVLHSRSETTLLMITGLALVLLAIYSLLEWLRSRILVRAGLRFDDMISNGLFSRVVTTTLRQPQARSEFALSDIDRLRDFLTGPGLIAICDLPWMPVFLIVCFLFHPLVGVISLVGALLIFGLAILNEFMTKRTLNEASGHAQAAQQFASSALQNVEVVRALGMERSLRSRWHDMHRNTLVKQVIASDRGGALQSLSKFIRMALQTIILGAGAYLSIEGEISGGAMIACSILMGRALQPIDQVVGQWKQFVGARQAYHRLSQIFRDVPDEQVRTQLPAPHGRLVVDQLTVVAPGQRMAVLQGISFHVQPGQAVAIVGSSGSGKSSLVRALVGVWSAHSGAVRLDGSELQHWQKDDLGRHFGYLPQSVELFAGTIAENISRFQYDALPQQIIAAATAARVHSMIQSLPNGYDTQIGSGGSSLSGGQRQRIGLARALFGNPAVIILDEPNANLDSDGEEALFQVIGDLKAAMKGVIFVSHKMSLVALAEKTLVLANGRAQSFGATRDIFQPKAMQAPEPAFGSASHPRHVA
ncbi:type I secretion system permease/ATPase [Rhizobium sp. B21/90]|uniref:type I secretion system permease/ATPase n=1 Tax=Rhizobium sp. B21/90 TaxID=2819993 RepID=UPI001C5BC8E4|nr:type I secretion system permease/ATPase [Rhizobium sp. B21/90]QYA03898.1 type I secretion system permease/ATPase [Rhizobium sp. B21/90]